MKTTKRFRTQYLINPKLQLFMVGLAVGLSLVNGLVLVVIFNYYFHNVFESLTVANIPDTHPLFRYLSLQQDKMSKNLLLAIAAFLALGSIVLLWASHKIAGPLYRLKLAVKEMLSENDQRPVTLRKGDFFHDMAADLESLRVKNIELREKLRKHQNPDT